jgi:hypothetical protein
VSAHTEIAPTSPQELSKSQTIRLVDVFLIAPFLVFIGLKKGLLSKTEKYIVILIGVATLYYNGKNYLKNRQ